MAKQQTDRPKFNPARPSGEQPQFRAAPIRARHILKANGLVDCSEKSRRYHRRRIEAWGASNREFLRSIGVRFVAKKASSS